MTNSGEVASADFIPGAAIGKRTMIPRIATALAAILILAAPALAGAATRQHVPAGDPDYRALYLDWREADRPEYQDAAIPAGSPVDSTNLTSGFGVRTDPFRGSAAMHPGIDLAAPLGTPVYA